MTSRFQWYLYDAEQDACMQGLAAFKKWHHDQLTGVPLDGAEMRVIVFITDLPTIHDILVHLREPTVPPGSRPSAAMRWGTRAMKQEKQNCRSAEIRLPYSRSRLRSIAVGGTRFRCNRDNLPRRFCAWTPPLSKACAWKTRRRS